MAKNVLFVTHDRGPGKFGPPIARELVKLGHEIHVAAAGPSVENWERAGFSVTRFESPDSVETATIYGHTAQAEVVVLGMSSPSQFERQFAEFVLKNRTGYANTPLVGIVDAWGAYHRMPRLDAYLTLDEVDRVNMRTSTLGFAGARTFAMGDLDPSPNVPDETRNLVEPILARHKYLFQLCSQKWPESRDIFALALAAAERSLASGEDVAFIESIHPSAADSVKVELNGILDAFAEKYPSRIYLLRTEEGKPLNGDHVAHLVKKVIAATGTALRIAAYDPEGIPICAWSPPLGEWIKKESGTLAHPLARAGAAIEFLDGEDRGLVAMTEEDGPTVIARKADLGIRRAPFNPAGAAQFIVSL